MAGNDAQRASSSTLKGDEDIPQRPLSDGRTARDSMPWLAGPPLFQDSDYPDLTQADLDQHYDSLSPLDFRPAGAPAAPTGAAVTQSPPYTGNIYHGHNMGADLTFNLASNMGGIMSQSGASNPYGMPQTHHGQAGLSYEQRFASSFTQASNIPFAGNPMDPHHSWPPSDALPAPSAGSAFDLGLGSLDSGVEIQDNFGLGDLIHLPEDFADIQGNDRDDDIEENNTPAEEEDASDYGINLDHDNQPDASPEQEDAQAPAQPLGGPEDHNAGVVDSESPAAAERTIDMAPVGWDLGQCSVQQRTLADGKSAGPAIILIHGDFHSNQTWLTKPDQTGTWVDYFLAKGREVFVPPLPLTSASTLSRDSVPASLEVDSEEISDMELEAEFTAPEKNQVRLYDTAFLHDKWPQFAPAGEVVEGLFEGQVKGGFVDIGGHRPDPIYEQYKRTTCAVYMGQKQRVELQATAIVDLLDRIALSGRKAVVVGEGLGWNVAMVAADRAPHMVAGVVCISPPAPPSGCAANAVYSDNGYARAYHHRSLSPDERLRYGISEAALTFEPPLREDEKLELQVVQRTVEYGGGSRLGGPNRPGGGKCYLQRDDGEHRVRTLRNLATIPHAVVSAEAAYNSAYDWAVVTWLRQAGLEVDWIKLAEHGICGNGRLCWLETNSDDIAAKVNDWVIWRAEHPTDPAAAAALVPNKADLDRAEARLAAERGKGALAENCLNERIEARNQQFPPNKRGLSASPFGFWSWFPKKKLSVATNAIIRPDMPPPPRPRATNADSDIQGKGKGKGKETAKATTGVTTVVTTTPAEEPTSPGEGSDSPSDQESDSDEYEPGPASKKARKSKARAKAKSKSKSKSKFKSKSKAKRGGGGGRRRR